MSSAGRHAAVTVADDENDGAGDAGEGEGCENDEIGRHVSIQAVTTM